MKKSLMFVGLSIFLLVCTMVSAGTYYFNSTSGNDANSCLTSALACKTISRAYTIAVTTNSTVYFNGCEEPYRGFYARGTASNITYTSYGGCGRAEIFGSINGSSDSYWVSLGGNLYRSQYNFSDTPNFLAFNTTGRNVGGVVIAGNNVSSISDLNVDKEWYFTNSSNRSIIVYLDDSPSSYDGIEIPAYNYSSSSVMWSLSGVNGDFEIQDLSFSFARFRALRLYNNNNNLVDNCTFNYVYQNPIYLDRTDNTNVSGNSFYLGGIKGQASPIGQSSQGENIITYGVDNVVIADNVVERCGGVCINPVVSRGVQVIRNRVFNGEGDPADWSAGIYLDACNNSLVMYNNVSGVNVGLEIASENGYSNNVSMRYNIVSDILYIPMLIDYNIADGKYILNSNITHNTFYQDEYTFISGNNGMVILQDYDNVTFKDNIIYDVQGNNLTAGRLFYALNGSRGDNYVGDNNLWYSLNRNKWYFKTTEHSFLADFATATGEEGSSLNLDASFVSSSDLTPTSDSPACGNASDGTDIGAIACAAASTMSSPVVNILSSPNGTVTSDTTPTISFNFTDSDSTTANCTLTGVNHQEETIYTTLSGNMSDGNIDTCAYYSGTNYMAYDKPANFTEVMWYVNRCTDNTKTICTSGGTTFPSYCLDYYEDPSTQAINLSISYSAVISEECFDGSIYNSIYGFGHYFCEEYMEWLIPIGSNSSTINNTNTNLISVELNDGNYTAFVSCVDGDGNAANSSLISFVVDSEIPIVNVTNPFDGMNTSSNSMNISFVLLHETVETPLSYFNISLYDSLGIFNKTIQGNNSFNTSYLWVGLLDGYSPGTYYVKVVAYDSSGGVLAYDYTLFNIVTDALLNVTAFGGGSLLSNFTITLSPGNSTVTTSGSVVVGIFKNFTYNVTISDSGFASTGVSMNWSNDTNYLLFNLTALANSVYITFKDFDNLSLSSGFNINLDYVGSSLSGNKSTNTGYMNISGLTVGDYTLRYGATGFETRFYSVTVTDESTQNITLYMIPSSSSGNVTVTVIDQNANPVMGAVVKALKYDLASNSYLLQEIASTDINGRVIMSLSMYDEYYKFMVEYDGVLEVTTSPSYITSNSLTIQILIGELVDQDYYHYANLYVDLSFNTVTNNFRLDYDDVDGIVDNVCLEVFTLGLLGQVPFNSSCSTSASGTLLVFVDAVNGTTYLAKAYYYDDGDKIFLISKTYTYPSGEVFGKTFGLLLQVVLTVFCAFIAVWNIPLAAILVPLSLVIGKLLQFNFFGWDALSALLVVGFIIAYVTRKNNG